MAATPITIRYYLTDGSVVDAQPKWLGRTRVSTQLRAATAIHHVHDLLRNQRKFVLRRFRRYTRTHRGIAPSAGLLRHMIAVGRYVVLTHATVQRPHQPIVLIRSPLADDLINAPVDW